MSKSTAPKGANGLRLTLGGAPATPHVVVGLPGLYRPDSVTPVGGPGEATLEAAQAAHDDPGVPVELVSIPDNELASVRDSVNADRQASQAGVLVARRSSPEGSEPEQIADEQRALAGQENK